MSSAIMGSPQPPVLVGPRPAASFAIREGVDRTLEPEITVVNGVGRFTESEHAAHPDPRVMCLRCRFCDRTCEGAPDGDLGSCLLDMIAVGNGPNPPDVFAHHVEAPGAEPHCETGADSVAESLPGDCPIPRQRCYTGKGLGQLEAGWCAGPSARSSDIDDAYGAQRCRNAGESGRRVRCSATSSAAARPPNATSACSSCLRPLRPRQCGG
jgi:hypothetical protein